MSKLTVTYTFDGEEITPDTIKAWELAAAAFIDALDRLDELPLGLVPKEMREQREKAFKALMDLAFTTRGIAIEARRYERAGTEAFLDAALDDARRAKKIK